MAVNQQTDRFHEHAELQQKAGVSDRMGYVHEVERKNGEQKIRVVIGIQQDGTPLLSPWLHTTAQGGGASGEQKLFEKGKSVRLSAPDGDWRQATVTPHAESEAHPGPAHADKVNGDTAQLGKLRISKNKPKDGGSGDHGYNIWIAEEDDKAPAHKEQTGKDESGGTGGAGGSVTAGSASSDPTQAAGGEKKERKAGKAALKFGVSDKGITGRFGKDIQFTAMKDGCKITAGKHSVIVTKEGKIICTKPPVIEKDPLENLQHDFDEG